MLTITIERSFYTMMSKMLLHLALLLVAPSNVSAFRSITHVSSAASAFGAVSTQQKVPSTPLFYKFGGGRDDHAVEKEFNIKDVTDEAEEALKAAAKSLHVSPATAAAAPHAAAAKPVAHKKEFVSPFAKKAAAASAAPHAAATKPVAHKKEFMSPFAKKAAAASAAKAAAAKPVAHKKAFVSPFAKKAAAAAAKPGAKVAPNTAPSASSPTKKEKVTAKASAHSKTPTSHLAPPLHKKEGKAAHDEPFLFFAKSVSVSPTPPATPPTVSLPAPTDEALASAFGGAVLGAVAASAIAAQFPELSDSFLAAFPPFISAAALGAAAHSGASEESRVGELTRKILGKNVIGIGKGLIASIKSVAGRIAAEITSIPRKIVSAITAIPGKIISAIQRQVKKITDKIKAIPSKFRAAAQRKAEKTAADTKKAAEAFATEVKATPGRVAESTKQAVNKSVDNTKQQVSTKVKEVQATAKEVQAYPSKKYAEIENSVTAFLGTFPPMAQAPPSKKAPEISLPVDLKFDMENFRRIPLVSYEF
jgi:hypothetical protein